MLAAVERKGLPEIVIGRRANPALRAFNADRLRWLDEAAAAGPVTSLRLGFVRMWVVTDPDIARTMLIANSADWTRPLSGRVPVRLAIGDNLFTASDKTWAVIQPALSPEFRRRALAPRLAALEPILDDEISALPTGAAVDLELLMRRITLIAAAWVLLGERLDRDRADELGIHEREVIGWVSRRIGTTTSALPLAAGRAARAMRRHAAPLQDYVREVIAGRRANRDHDGDPGGHDGHDVLAALLAARPGGKPLGERALVSHVLGLFLAGNETTATALSWALVHAASNPTPWAATATDPTAAEHYVAETLRLTPAVWGLAHLAARRGVTLATPAGPIPVKRTDAVTTYVRGINHDPHRWPDPHRFLPERHADATPAQQQSQLTFGLGPRGCIGQHLAMAELAAAVPRLARYQVNIDQPIDFDASFSLRVKGGLTGTLQPRPAQPTDAR